MKQHVRTGSLEDRYHRLFLDRLSREGRYGDFCRARSKLYHSDDWHQTWRQTWWPIARVFGFISKRDEVSRFEEYMLFGARTKMQRELHQMQEEIRHDCEEKNRIESAPAGAPELPPDVAWVYEHPAMGRKVKDGVIPLKSSDFEGAPSQGAIGMLNFAARQVDAFYRLVFGHLSKKDIKADDEEDVDATKDQQSIDEIRKMIEQL